jgi:hypothetical protein
MVQEQDSEVGEASTNSWDDDIHFPERFPTMESIEVDLVDPELHFSRPEELGLVPPETPCFDDLPRRPVFDVLREEADS